MKFMQHYAAVDIDTGVVATDFLDKPVKGLSPAEAKKALAKRVGQPVDEIDDVLDDLGLELVVVDYAIELAFKALRAGGTE